MPTGLQRDFIYFLKKRTDCCVRSHMTASRLYIYNHENLNPKLSDKWAGDVSSCGPKKPSHKHDRRGHRTQVLHPSSRMQVQSPIKSRQCKLLSKTICATTGRRLYAQVLPQDCKRKHLSSCLFGFQNQAPR